MEEIDKAQGDFIKSLEAYYRAERYFIESVEAYCISLHKQGLKRSSILKILSFGLRDTILKRNLADYNF